MKIKNANKTQQGRPEKDEDTLCKLKKRSQSRYIHGKR